MSIRSIFCVGTLQHHKAESKVLREPGVTFEGAYRALTGEEPPPELGPRRPVYVPEKLFASLLRCLPDVQPEGVTFGFSFDDELAWFDSSVEDLDIEVQRALALARE